MTRGLIAGLAVLFLAVPGVARAESNGDQARAEALFQEGKALRGAGLYPAACVDFEESRRLDEGIGVTLYLADCYQQAGDKARAVTEFRRAAALAKARGDRREAVARHRAEELEASLHPVAAAAPPVPSPAPAPSPPVDESPPPPPPTHATRRWVGGGLTALGAIGLGTGAVLGAVALSKLSQSNDGPCGPDDRCTSRGLELRHQSQGAATGSTIAFLSGAAAAAAGVAIILTTPRDGEPVTVAPAVMTGGAGAFLQGRF